MKTCLICGTDKKCNCLSRDELLAVKDITRGIYRLRAAGLSYSYIDYIVRSVKIEINKDARIKRT